MVICTNLGGNINIMNDDVKIIITNKASTTMFEVNSINSSSAFSSVSGKQTLTFGVKINYNGSSVAISTPGVYTIVNGTLTSLPYSYVSITDGFSSLVVNGPIYNDNLEKIADSYTYDASAPGEKIMSFFVDNGTKIDYVLNDGCGIFKNGVLHNGETATGSYGIDATKPTGGGSGQWTADSALYVTSVYLPKITINHSGLSFDSGKVVYNDDGSVTITARAKVSNENTVLVATDGTESNIVVGSQETETQLLVFKKYYSTVIITVREDCTVTITSGNINDYQ